MPYNGTVRNAYDVAIVGAGPTALTAAAVLVELGGVRSCISTSAARLYRSSLSSNVEIQDLTPGAGDVSEIGLRDLIASIPMPYNGTVRNAKSAYDVAIVGAGPNGLTAAAVLSLAGLSVIVLERNARIGGSCRTEPLTQPGFLHDVCGAIHPMGVVSPIFRALDLTSHGVDWVTARVPLAHPLDNGRAAVLSRRLSDTVTALGRDGRAWENLLRPFVDHHESFFSEIMRPVRAPRDPLLMMRFGMLALRSCSALIQRFQSVEAKALLAGNAAHSCLPLDAAGSAAFAIILATATHAVDWPCVRGGSQQIVEALAGRARSAGCEIHTDVTVRSLADVPASRAVLLDVTPRQLLAIVGSDLSVSYRRRLERYRYGAAAFKIDYALSDKIPWRARECADAATVHVGGSYEEIARSESDANAGRHSDAPFVLVAQQSSFDQTRAPVGRQTGWVYCHVPNGSQVDMTDRIERQIERFAPGFRDTILERHVMPPAALEAHNPNLVGGDILGGATTLAQSLFRPFPRWNPYATSSPRVFIGSSSTPPGGGIHGMCGYWAARSVLGRVFRAPMPSELDI